MSKHDISFVKPCLNCKHWRKNYWRVSNVSIQKYYKNIEPIHINDYIGIIIDIKNFFFLLDRFSGENSLESGIAKRSWDHESYEAAASTYPYGIASARQGFATGTGGTGVGVAVGGGVEEGLVRQVNILQERYIYEKISSPSTLLLLPFSFLALSGFWSPFTIKWRFLTRNINSSPRDKWTKK